MKSVKGGKREKISDFLFVCVSVVSFCLFCKDGLRKTAGLRQWPETGLVSQSAAVFHKE